MSPDTVFKKNSDLIGRRVDDGLVLVSPLAGEVKVLNPVGAVIWELVDGKTALSEIEFDLKSRFTDIPAEQIDTDLHQFLKDLTDRNLLEKL